MPTTVKKEIPDGWSPDGQTYYNSGRAFGLTEDLQTIYLGDADVIKKSLETKQLPEELNPLQREVLTYILECREELKDGEFKPKKRSAVRSRITRDFKRREASIRQTAFRETLPMRLSK